jgi:hypothetical protein
VLSQTMPNRHFGPLASREQGPFIGARDVVRGAARLGAQPSPGVTNPDCIATATACERLRTPRRR